MGRPWTLQLGALAMDCLRVLQTLPEPKLGELTQPIDKLGPAISVVHGLVKSLHKPGWIHEYAKGTLSSKQCVKAHQTVLQVCSSSCNVHILGSRF